MLPWPQRVQPGYAASHGGWAASRIWKCFGASFFTSCHNNLFLPHPLRPDAGVWKLWRDPLSGGTHITPRQAVDSVDWGELVDFTLFKTIPLFWIPINTVGFFLPQEYRIVFAAVLSLVFGILMTILKLRERKNQSRKESLV